MRWGGLIVGALAGMGKYVSDVEWGRGGGGADAEETGEICKEAAKRRATIPATCAFIWRANTGFKTRIQSAVSKIILE